MFCRRRSLSSAREALPPPPVISRARRAPARGGPWSFPPVQIALKAALCEAWRQAGTSQRRLARDLDVAESEVPRMSNPEHGTKAATIGRAPSRLGKRITVTVGETASTGSPLAGRARSLQGRRSRDGRLAPTTPCATGSGRTTPRDASHGNALAPGSVAGVSYSIRSIFSGCLHTVQRAATPSGRSGGSSIRTSEPCASMGC